MLTDGPLRLVFAVGHARALRLRGLCQPRRGGRRARRILVAAAVGAALATVGAVVALAANDSLREATSGRSELVTNTAYVIAAHPLVGVGIGGIGGEEQASREEGEKRGLLSKPLHTPPLTVAAEPGALGVAAYLLLAATGRALARLGRVDRPLALCLAALILVLLVHSLFYSGFFEDPLTWGTLGLITAALAASEGQLRRPGARQA